MALVFSSTLPWALRSSARTRTSCSLFKLSLQLFSIVLLFFETSDPRSATTSETSFHVPRETWLFPLILRNDSTLISFAILLTTIQNFSLSWPSSEMQGSLSPSILILQGKETATTTKIPSYSDWQQMARTHFRSPSMPHWSSESTSFSLSPLSNNTQSPSHHFSFQVPDSFKHALQNFTYRPQETRPWSIHPPARQNESILECQIGCLIVFLEDHPHHC